MNNVKSVIIREKSLGYNMFYIFLCYLEFVINIF